MECGGLAAAFLFGCIVAARVRFLARELESGG
jgi:hypothetical protein